MLPISKHGRQQIFYHNTFLMKLIKILETRRYEYCKCTTSNKKMMEGTIHLKAETRGGNDMPTGMVGD